MDSDSIYAPEIIVAFSANFKITRPPAFKIPFPIPFMPRAIMISPSASIVAPSTTPFTSTLPFALMAKPAWTLPFTMTLPSDSILPVAVPTFSTSYTSDTKTLSSVRHTCPLIKERISHPSSDISMLFPYFNVSFLMVRGLIISPYTVVPFSPGTSLVRRARRSPVLQWFIVFKWKKSTDPSSFLVGLVLKSVLKKYSMEASVPWIGAVPLASTISAQ